MGWSIKRLSFSSCWSQLQKHQFTKRFLFWRPHTRVDMKDEQNSSPKVLYGPQRPSSELQASGHRDSSTNFERTNPFAWVTWLSKLMAGEKQCEWACWFRSHYIWDKLPNGLYLAKWTADHAQLLRVRRAALEDQGFAVYTEEQNSFTLTGKTVLTIGGPEPAKKVPSWGECRYCDISKADCPHRIVVRPGTTSSHGLF